MPWHIPISRFCRAIRDLFEEGTLPHDAKVVDRTWQYVNKNGGPDRRFNNNRELPVCLYEDLKLSSASGLNELLQVSALGHGDDLKNAVRSMADAIEQSRKSEEQRRKAEHEQRREPSRMAAMGQQEATDVKQINQKPTLELVCDSLLNILCSIMVADGRASRSERACIVDLMQKVKSQMTPEEVAHRMDAYIDAISSIGYKKVLAQSLEKVIVFREIGKEHVLLQCIEAVARADATLDPREQALCMRIRQLLCSGNGREDGELGSCQHR